jgi:hypothetical protein
MQQMMAIVFSIAALIAVETLIEFAVRIHSALNPRLVLCVVASRDTSEIHQIAELVLQQPNVEKVTKLVSKVVVFMHARRCIVPEMQFV